MQKIQSVQKDTLIPENGKLSNQLWGKDSEVAEKLSCALFRQLRWPAGVVCPHCLQGCEMQGTIGFDGWLGFTRKYQCHCCQAYFNDRTETLMCASSLGMAVWFKAIYLIGVGLSNQSLHHQLGVHPNTAQFMGVRIRQALTENDPLICLTFDHLNVNGTANQALDS